jgi:hypothetical protein
VKRWQPSALPQSIPNSKQAAPLLGCTGIVGFDFSQIADKALETLSLFFAYGHSLLSPGLGSRGGERLRAADCGWIGWIIG